MLTNRIVSSSPDSDLKGASSFVSRCIDYLTFSKCADDGPILSISGQELARSCPDSDTTGASSFVSGWLHYLTFPKKWLNLLVHGQELARWMLLGLVVLPSLAVAEDFPRPNRIYTVETTGEIRSIDLAAREARIGGFTYYFGSPIYGNSSEVKLYNVGYGSFEMLYVGMKVKVRFADTGVSRYVVLLEQLSSTALVGS